MKVIFVSNFLTHHQVPFCEEMQKKLGNDFKFVSTVKIFFFFLYLGFKDLDQEYDYVVRAYESDEAFKEAKKLVDEADIVIIGSTTDDLLVDRLKQDKIVVRYRSRIWLFVDGFWKTVFNKDKIKLLYGRHLKYRKNKNLYLLCANAYGANDFGGLGLYKNKMYKWGYFLETNKYNIDELIAKKEQNEKMQIIWVARFLKWKHPEYVVKLAKKLKAQNYKFHIQMLGQGVLEEKTRQQIKQNNLEDVVEIVGQVPSDKVKDYMEKANIFIGTSDSNEGWGAVINESMNAGCAVVASKKMGSVPFLIKNRENGLIFNTFEEFENEVKEVIDNKELREKLSKNAYEFITEKWTAKIATENLLKLFESILAGNEVQISEGPASKAEKI